MEEDETLDRKEIQARLRSAKSAHLQWRANAQGLLAGLPLDEGKVPVAHTECRFGKWYYGQGQMLVSLASYQAIEGPHDTLHAVYRRIVEALYGEVEQPSLMARLLGKRAKDDRERRRDADRLMVQLVAVSETLLASVEILEQEIAALSDADLKILEGAKASA